jgi:hypothetical protein
MINAQARPRYSHCLLVVLALCGCRSPTPVAPVRVVNLLREMDRADKRPPAGFSVTEYRVGDAAHPAIAAAVPSRLTVPLPLPRRGVFHAFAAIAENPAVPRTAGVRIRIGVSDHRIYEGLTDLVLTSGSGSWSELRVDLSAYAGWKWSLFYRPERIVWRLVLAADRMDGVPATVLWGAPEIVTDGESAREYIARRQRLR